MINLRLWDSIPDEVFNLSRFNQGDYYAHLKAKQDALLITSTFYQIDSSDIGKELKLKQLYFFVCATIQDILRRFFKDKNNDLVKLYDKVTIQLTESSTSLAIVELYRVLVDIYDMEYVEAWNIVQNVFSYTYYAFL